MRDDTEARGHLRRVLDNLHGHPDLEVEDGYRALGRGPVHEP